MDLKRIVEKDETRAGRIFDYTVQFLIILSLATFTFSTLPDLSEQTVRILYIIQVVTVSLFTLEYLLRVFVVDNKLKYIFSFYGMIDLFAILPFYFSFTIDLRSIRIVRLLKLFRILKFGRYNRAMDRLKKGIYSIKEELVLFLFATAFLIYVSAVGVYYFENPAQPEQFTSIFSSLWWAVVTLTTVGYGDIHPITVGGKIFASLILMIGLGIVAVPAGLLASALQKPENSEETED
jgi:voltage-gated potassium channel